MIALLDLDILVYRVGFAANKEPWKFCKSRLDKTIADILFTLDVEDQEGWLTEGTHNYRHEYAVTAPYKGSRPNIKPVHYDAIRSYLMDSWGAKLESEQEADDAIGIRCTELGDDSVIVTIDKDLDNIPGNHYNFVKQKEYYVDPEAALRNFYRQILVGDRIDNVVGVRGIGPRRAERIYGSESTEAGLYACAVEAFGGSETRVVENARLLWIRRHPGEIWQPPTHRGLDD